MNVFYSKRLLLPYIGVIQVAELGWARAMSLDGKHWALRYAQDEVEKIYNGPLRYEPRANCSLVVSIEGERVQTRITRRNLDPKQASADGWRLFEALATTRIPFPKADHFEYWLLDAEQGRPLALLQTWADEEDMQLQTPEPEWQAIPAMGMAVDDPHTQDQEHPLPVNYRLESLVAERAGARPQAAWFQRVDGDEQDFPSLLLREDWDEKEGQRLCELYLRRLAPRLLMLPGLARDRRIALEQAAREHALEVNSYYSLYPEVINQKLMNAARVEARLRNSAKS